MTDERIREIKALYEATTPGPWLEDKSTGGLKIALGENDFYSIAKEIYFEPDIKFIAAAREIIPELLEALEDSSKWISCSERLPEKFKEVLCAIKNHREQIVAYVNERWEWERENSRDGIGNYVVTHWQPLPEPPEATAQ